MMHFLKLKFGNKTNTGNTSGNKEKDCKGAAEVRNWPVIQGG